MNVFLLPHLCALLVFLGAFRPLARRAGPHSNDWFLGWAFVFVHVVALTFYGAASTSTVIRLTGFWALEVAGILFLRAAAQAPKDWTSFALSTEMMVPILLQSALLALRVPSSTLHFVATLLMVVPFVHLRLAPTQRTFARDRMSSAFALAAVVLAPLSAFHPSFALSLVHGCLFLGAAWLYWQYVRQASPGVLTAIFGLIFWGISFPVAAIILYMGGWSPTAEMLLQMPDYIVAYGIILTLIEEHVQRTESLALHDSLTGLPNRRLLDDRLDQAISMAPHTGAMLACLVIDVDNFKKTNDTLGHLVGDGLLQAVATRLSWHIAPGDTLARTGGDEFTAVLTRLQSYEHLRFIAGAMMSSTCVPVMVGELSLNIGLSIGIAVYPESGSITADQLRREADDAMYEAKRAGGNRFSYLGGPPDEAAHLLSHAS